MTCASIYFRNAVTYLICLIFCVAISALKYTFQIIPYIV